MGSTKISLVLWRHKRSKPIRTKLCNNGVSTKLKSDNMNLRGVSTKLRGVSTKLKSDNINLQSRAKIMRLYLLYTSFSFSGVNPRTFRIFMTYPPPPPPFTMLRTSYSTQKCGLVSLQQHCFRGEGGSKYKVSKIFARDCL